MLPGRVFSCGFSAVAVTVAQDLFQILAPADAVLAIMSCKIGQHSDPADAQAELLEVEIVHGRGAATDGSGGTTGTEEGHNPGAGSAGGVVELNNTTRLAAGSGSLHVLLNESWNVQIPYLWQPPDQEMHIISPTEWWTIALPSAPADSLTMDGTLTWMELGG